MRGFVNITTFLCILSLSLFLLLLCSVYQRFIIQMNDEFYMNSLNQIIQRNKIYKEKPRAMVKLPSIKYILIWTSPSNVPFVYLEDGQKRFIKNHCPYINCFVTSDKHYLEDYTQFDAVIFAGPELITDDDDLPARRSLEQKYVFVSIESSHSYPVCSNRFDGFFNWTWTYRLDSDSRWGYITVRELKTNKIIGPNKVMHWMKSDDMKPVSEEFRMGLLSKTKAAAWFVSNCHSDSGRAYFVHNLKIELELYGLTVDVYGRCGKLICPKHEEKKCGEMIRKKYYFYLAFENSFSEDYVTEKLLHGLENNAIPIVYGGANYTRFMPDGIYLDARQLGPKRLADKMYELINNPHKYAEYFKWTNHYKYYKKSESVETDDYCSICKLLNNKKKLKTTSVYKNFRKWWDSPKFC